MADPLELKQQIKQERYNRIFQVIGRAGDSGATIREVAEGLTADGLPFKGASPYLTNLLDEMVRFGWLRKEEGIIQTGRGARIGWRYFVVPVS